MLHWPLSPCFAPVMTLTHPRSYAPKASPPGLSWHGSGNVLFIMCNVDSQILCVCCCKWCETESMCVLAYAYTLICLCVSDWLSFSKLLCLVVHVILELFQITWCRLSVVRDITLLKYILLLRGKPIRRPPVLWQLSVIQLDAVLGPSWKNCCQKTTGQILTTKTTGQILTTKRFLLYASSLWPCLTHTGWPATCVTLRTTGQCGASTLKASKSWTCWWRQTATVCTLCCVGERQGSESPRRMSWRNWRYDVGNSWHVELEVWWQEYVAWWLRQWTIDPVA